MVLLEGLKYFHTIKKENFVCCWSEPPEAQMGLYVMHISCEIAALLLLLLEVVSGLLLGSCK